MRNVLNSINMLDFFGLKLQQPTHEKLPKL